MVNSTSRCVIISASPELDSEFLKTKINSDDYIICADGGADKLIPIGIVPDLIIGDFDSSDIEAESEFGSVNIKLVGTSEDYSYDLKTEFGSITLDGDKVGKSEDVSEKTYVDGKGSKKIKVRAESGSIKIDFK